MARVVLTLTAICGKPGAGKGVSGSRHVGCCVKKQQKVLCSSMNARNPGWQAELVYPRRAPILVEAGFEFIVVAWRFRQWFIARV